MLYIIRIPLKTNNNITSIISPNISARLVGIVALTNNNWVNLDELSKRPLN